MSDPRVSGTVRTLEKLYPGSEVSHSSCSEFEFLERNPELKLQNGVNFGTLRRDGRVLLWQRIKNGAVFWFELTRRGIPLGSKETKVLDAFDKTQRGLFAEHENRAAQSSSRMASFSAFGNILVARYLRGRAASNFWTPQLILSEVQSLSLQRYEGSPCTSGIVFTSEPTIFVKKLDKTLYDLEGVDYQGTFDVDFFSSPPTYRYVDGKNAFYVVDNSRKIIGVLRIRSPMSYTVYDRAVFSHLRSVFELEAGRTFVAISNNQGTVTVQSRNGLQLRWKNLFWSVCDTDIIVDFLIEFGLEVPLATKIVSLLFAISDMRFGALLLVVDSDCALPRSAGSIGGTDFSAALKELSKGKTVTQAMESNEILGILTSDGLTTINKDGVVLSAGDIIDLSGPGESSVTGGGRTQAAVAASRFGVALKISEDGPITVFHKGDCVIKMQR